jgi:hypothetical protein
LVELLAVAALAAGAWFLWSSLRARESANDAIRRACRGEGYLFLDDTVALHRIRLRRDDEGRARIERVYRFDYSDTGDNRRRGYVTLLGARVTDLSLGVAATDIAR